MVIQGEGKVGASPGIRLAPWDGNGCGEGCSDGGGGGMLIACVLLAFLLTAIGSRRLWRQICSTIHFQYPISVNARAIDLRYLLVDGGLRRRLQPSAHPKAAGLSGRAYGGFSFLM